MGQFDAFIKNIDGNHSEKFTRNLFHITLRIHCDTCVCLGRGWGVIQEGSFSTIFKNPDTEHLIKLFTSCH